MRLPAAPLDEDQRAKLREAGRLAGQKSLATYAVGVMPGYQLATHLEIIISVLERVERGEIKRLMITAPPRHSKSLTTTQIFPAWFQGKNPTKKVMTACHTQSLASDFGGKTRDFIHSNEHKHIFPEHRIGGSSDSKSEWKSTLGGEFFAAGITGAHTGRGADLLLIDDPFKTKQEACSPVMRKNVHDFYTAVGVTRLQPDGRIIIINTRWHEHDLTGWLLDPHSQEEVDDWYVLNLPAIAEVDEGWRKPGDPLWPSWYSLKALLKIKKAVGMWDWSAMYQQAPSAIEGMLVKRSWFPRYHWNPHMAANRSLVSILTQPYQIIQSWDTALEEGLENDYSVCETWLKTKGHDFLLDVWRQKVNSPELLKAAEELAIYWGAAYLLVEDSTPGKAFIQHMRIKSQLPIIGRKPKGQKLVRLQAVSPHMEAGTVHLPTQAPWLADWLTEHCAFPTSAHDDQVDTTSQYLDYVWEQRMLQMRLEGEHAADEEINPHEV